MSLRRFTPSSKPPCETKPGQPHLPRLVGRKNVLQYQRAMGELHRAILGNLLRRSLYVLVPNLFHSRTIYSIADNIQNRSVGGFQVRK
jgi:hypothetical protein